MSVIKKSIFSFEEIDLENGSCVVRFINPYGVIETKQKTLNDFKQMIDVPTGSFQLDGTPVTRKKEIIVNDNPNDDLIFSHDIPLDLNGKFIELNDLIDYIARQYPHDIFDRKQKINQSKKNTNSNLKTLEKQRFDVEIVYEPIPDPSLLQIEEL